MFVILKKSIIIFCGVMSVVLSSSVFAENLDRSEDSKKLSAITPRFCNNNEITKDLDLGSVNTNEDIDLCVGVLNSYEENVKIKMYFTDSIEPTDGSDKYTCRLEEDEKVAFGKYVYFTNDYSEKSSKLIYDLKKDETLFTKAIVNLPENYNGKLVGCLVTEIAGFKEIEGYLNVKVRRANLVTLLPNGEVKIAFNVVPGEVNNNKNEDNSNNNFLASILGVFDKTELDTVGTKIINYNDQIVIKKDKNTEEIFAQMRVNNSGGVPLEIKIDSNIKNIFGFKKNIKVEEVVNVQENKLIKFAIDDLPFYGGSYTISMNVKSDPIIDEEIKDKVDKTKVSAEEEFYELNMYIFPTMIVFWSMIFVLTIIFLFTLWQQKLKK